MVPLIILAAAAIAGIVQALSETRVRTAFCGAVLAFFGAYTAGFAYYYFTKYNTEIAVPFDSACARRISRRWRVPGKDEKVWITGPGGPSPYIYPLFFEPSLMASFHASARYGSARMTFTRSAASAGSGSARRRNRRRPRPTR